MFLGCSFHPIRLSCGGFIGQNMQAVYQDGESIDALVTAREGSDLFSVFSILFFCILSKCFAQSQTDPYRLLHMPDDDTSRTRWSLYLVRGAESC